MQAIIGHAEQLKSIVLGRQTQCLIFSLTPRSASYEEHFNVRETTIFNYKATVQLKIKHDSRKGNP